MAFEYAAANWFSLLDNVELNHRYGRYFHAAKSRKGAQKKRGISIFIHFNMAESSDNLCHTLNYFLVRLAYDSRQY